MIRRRTRSLAAVLAASALAALALAPREAGAFVREMSNWNPASLPIPYRINTSSAPPSIGASGATTAVDGGFSTWAGPSCTRWRATNAGTTTVTRGNSSDGQNSILWISGTWPAELGDVRTVIGVTLPVWRVGGYFQDADIQFNNVGFTWSMTGAGGTVDAQSIATHEEGHFLGLDHSPISSAIMYASYSGGIKRTLSSDDTSGVCTIYPSGGPVPDAGMPPSDPCTAFSSCAGCTPNASCGWCGASNTCQTGGTTGPTMGSCGGGWIWQPSDCRTAPPPDAGSSSDPCSRFTTCGTCTPVAGCGWCGGAGQCVSGTMTGPSGGSCGSGWAWLPGECTGGTPGGSAFGEPCMSPRDCASGGLCATTDGVTGFCTRTCTDDCTCPRDYHCVSNSSGTLRACVPGANSCPMMMGMPDSGTTPGPDGSTPPADSGSTGMPDAGSAHNDASTDAAARRDGGPIPVDMTGCGCATTPTRDPSRGARTLALALLAAGALCVGGRRRRR